MIIRVMEKVICAQLFWVADSRICDLWLFTFPQEASKSYD